jgi:arylsulfatase A-like enzyme
MPMPVSTPFVFSTELTGGTPVPRSMGVPPMSENVRMRTDGGTDLSSKFGRPLRRLLLVLASAFGLLVGPVVADAAEASPSAWATRPNVILILADDMGFSDLGSYGSEIRTPNLDALGQNGMRFTQFYNAARCCPSRASLLTGLYPHEAGIGLMVGRSASYPGDLSQNAITLGEALGAAGYSTYMSGKWHVTPYRPNTPSFAQNGPMGRGFEHFYGIIQSIRSYYNPPSLMEDSRVLPAPEGDYHFTDAVTEHAVRFVKSQPEGKPYFLYAAYAAPHFPLHAREADIAKYRGRFKAGWDALRKERYRRMVEMKLIDASWSLPPRDAQEMAWADLNPAYLDWFDERMAVYAAMVEQMDRGVGAIMDAVKARGDSDNTIVLFLSDNGGCAEELYASGNAAEDFPRQTRAGAPVRPGNEPGIMPGPENTYGSYGMDWAGYSNTPFRLFKSFVHEGGISTPLIVWWPSRIKPAITRETGHIIDVMPTLLELARSSYPAEFKGNRVLPMEGRSLVPVLAGGTRPEATYIWEHEGNRAIRQGDWKLVSRLPGAWELYDLRADRTETRDLAKTMPEKVAALAALYEKEAQRTGIKPFAGQQTPVGRNDNSIYRKK